MDTLALSCSEWVSEWVSAWMCLFLRFAAPKADGAARIKWQARCAVIEMLSSVNYEIPNVMAPVLFKIFCPFICPHPPQKENPAVWNMLQNIIIILRLVVCECANWVLGLREAYIWTWIYCILECDTVLPGRHADGLEKPSSSMTRVATRGEVSGGWKNLRNEELHYLSLSLNANKMMKSSSMRCTGGMQSTGELTNACTVLIAPPRPRHVCTGYVWLMIRTTGACYSNDTDQLSDYHLLKISCSACR